RSTESPRRARRRRLRGSDSMTCRAGREGPLLDVRVLLVEDYDDLRETLHLVLESAGARVTSVPRSSVEHAVRAGGLPDVAVIAVSHPDNDEALLFLTHSAHASDRDVAVVTLCSTGAPPRHRVDAAVPKPVTAGKLVDTVLTAAQR